MERRYVRSAEGGVRSFVVDPYVIGSDFNEGYRAPVTMEAPGVETAVTVSIVKDVVWERHGWLIKRAARAQARSGQRVLSAVLAVVEGSHAVGMPHTMHRVLLSRARPHPKSSPTHDLPLL